MNNKDNLYVNKERSLKSTVKLQTVKKKKYNDMVEKVSPI